MTSGEKTWRVLDLYCCAGGSARGYELGGFDEIVGIDHIKKKEYPYFFIQADITDFIYEQPREWFESFDLIHASPPCQYASRTKHLAIGQGNIPSDDNQLPMIRQFLRSLDVEYVIENVPEAWTQDQKKNIWFGCGSHFSLGVQRHRYFESSFPIEQLECDHNTSAWPIGPKGKPKPLGIYGKLGDYVGMIKWRRWNESGREGPEPVLGGWTAKTIEEAQEAMGITHITQWTNLREAIPPKYTEHVAKCFFEHMTRKETAQVEKVQSTLERWA